METEAAQFFMTALRLAGRMDTRLNYNTVTKSERLKLTRTFELDDEDFSVESIDASPFFPLFVVSYTSVSNFHRSKIVVWSLNNKLPEKVLNTSTRIKVVQFSKTKSNIIYGCGMNGKLVTWDLNSHSSFTLGESMKFRNCHSFPIVGMVQDSGKSYTCGIDGVVCFWSLFIDTGGPMGNPIQLVDDTKGEELSISALTNYEGDSIVGCENGDVYRVKLETGKLEKLTSHIKGLVTGLDVDPESATVITAGLDKTIHQIDLISKSAQTINQKTVVMDLKFQAKGKRQNFVTVDLDGNVMLWNLKDSLEPLETIRVEHGLNKVMWFSNENIFLCGGVRGEVHLFELRDM
ncbi:unnamed protein product [Kuraishia capsulata CBS 1993]|uniref:Anaphase-promoting complex subunit 4 WD40 domain-containing protein n=1 Tax=Kuraishia capsulata CBS 1993 TaxID=1382522 RepID=W6MV66_9ASCO|nr:uncharacterized protein KUCA_T00002066001 [Kuraishia capsulata CBS 1993]CDK26095.1 unnamed protein product [Kuraishia capsulata CBS 1993]